MAVRPETRRVFAFLSGCGLALSALGYVESFSPGHADTIFHLWLILLPLWMALLIPMYAIEYPGMWAWNFAWKVLRRGMPRWVLPAYNLLLLIALGHFIWADVRCGWGVPGIRGGEYVLVARGHILKTLTEAEYLGLRAAVARMFATGMASLYFPLTMYWWCRRNDRQAAG